MSNVLPNNGQELVGLLEKVVVMGDISSLTPAERLSYYQKVCESVGLNPLTRPFDYINLNGKLTLYARKDATDQLRKIHSISINITSRERIGDIYVVTAKAWNKEGREDEAIGAVSIANLKGDQLANALMKAETKAKRRVTLSIAGLGMLDETELETIPFDNEQIELAQFQQTQQPVQLQHPQQNTQQEQQRQEKSQHPKPEQQTKNMETKTPQSTQQQHSNNPGVREYTLLNMEFGTSPQGVAFAKIFVKEHPTPILAKGQEGVNEANKINVGEGEKVFLETYVENGFTFLKKVVQQQAVA